MGILSKKYYWADLNIQKNRAPFIDRETSQGKIPRTGKLLYTYYIFRKA